MAKPHKLALFALVPRNPGAQAVLEHPHNRHLVSVFQDPKVEGQTLIGLSVGLHIVSKSRFTLATIGRSGADISVEGANISRIQCSFEVHETTEEIMLYDRSAAQTTQVCGRKSTPFRAGTVRRVVVDKKTNLEFAFGGIDRNLVHFRIVWLKSDYDLTEPISNREDHPCFARTVDDDLAIAPSIRATRIHIGGNRLDIRYSPRKQLGKGAFGTVWKIANIDTGEHYALKKMEWPELQSRKYIAMKREVEALSRLSHVSHGLFLR